MFVNQKAPEVARDLCVYRPPRHGTSTCHACRMKSVALDPIHLTRMPIDVFASAVQRFQADSALVIADLWREGWAWVEIQMRFSDGNIGDNVHRVLR